MGTFVERPVTGELDRGRFGNSDSLNLTLALTTTLRVDGSQSQKAFDPGSYPMKITGFALESHFFFWSLEMCTQAWQPNTRR